MSIEQVLASAEQVAALRGPNDPADASEAASTSSVRLNITRMRFITTSV